MNKPLCFLIISLFVGLKALAHISPNSSDLHTYKYQGVYFDFGAFNEWMDLAETQPMDESIQNLQALLPSLQANFERMRVCNSRFVDQKSFFNLKVSSNARKVLVHYARLAMEEIDTFPFGVSSFFLNDNHRKFLVAGLFHCVDFDFNVQQRSLEEDKELTRRYGDSSLQGCIPRISRINSASAEEKDRKMSALIGLYRLLLITSCSNLQMTDSPSNDPALQEDKQILNQLIQRNIDFRDRSDIGIKFNHWMKSLL